MITVNLDTKGYTGHILLEPNLSLSWKHNTYIFIFISFFTLLVSGYFVAKGGWLVLPFSGLELIVIAVSLYMFFNHYNQCEVIHFTDNKVVIEQGKNSPEISWEYQRHWSKIHVQNLGPYDIPRVSIKSHGNETELGTFLGYDEKITLIRTLEDITTSFQSQDWRK